MADEACERAFERHKTAVSPFTTNYPTFRAGWGAALAAQPPHSCAECGGKASTPDSMWALYCVECIEKKIAPALQPPEGALALLRELADALRARIDWNRDVKAADLVRRAAAVSDAAESGVQPAPQKGEPFWHAVVSERCPVINKAIRSEEVAEEYASKCRKQGYTGIELVPLYRHSKGQP